MNLFKKTSPAFEKMIEEIDKIPEKQFIEISKNVYSKIFYEILNEERRAFYDDMMRRLNSYNEYSDLVKYYEALEFVNNIVDNDFDMSINRRSGYDMLKKYAKRENVYAERFLKFNPDPIE